MQSYHMHKLVTLDIFVFLIFLFCVLSCFIYSTSRCKLWSSHCYTCTQMLVMGKGMAPVVPPELQQYMHYITADPAQIPPLRPSGQQPRPFQITQANPQRQSNVESDFLSQMQNLHPSEPPQNFLRPPKLQLYTPVRKRFKLLRLSWSGLAYILFYFSLISCISKNFLFVEKDEILSC